MRLEKTKKTGTDNAAVNKNKHGQMNMDEEMKESMQLFNDKTDKTLCKAKGKPTVGHETKGAGKSKK